MSRYSPRAAGAHDVVNVAVGPDGHQPRLALADDVELDGKAGEAWIGRAGDRHHPRPGQPRGGHVVRAEGRVEGQPRGRGDAGEIERDPGRGVAGGVDEPDRGGARQPGHAHLAAAADDEPR